LRFSFVASLFHASVLVLGLENNIEICYCVQTAQSAVTDMVLNNIMLKEASKTSRKSSV
jgi:hypothetical protein